MATRKPSKPSKRIVLTGTEQPDVIGQILTAGPLSVEFDSGNLRYIRLNGVEVLRAVAFLVRNENWGTYPAVLRNLRIDQRKDGFSVSYQASCSRPDQQIEYDARIEGRADGALSFKATATPRTDFLTARTGFVVLHPLSGVVGHALTVEHVDGSLTRSSFPEQVNPDCPFRNIRALSHEALPGVWARCQMEGDAFEMEDQRNWTDASFKTYVRPLSRPWPYTLNGGEAIEQSVTLGFSGVMPKAAGVRQRQGLHVTVGAAQAKRVPPIGLGVPAEEIEAALAKIALVRQLGANFLVCFFDPRLGHGVELLRQYQRLSEQTRAKVLLELVVQSQDDFAGELQRHAAYAQQAGLKPAWVAVCPVGHLKSVLPGGTYPPAPPLEDLYAAARRAFPRAKLGGGMFSFFTELNRKRPPAQLLDFITNSTTPIVHAADDRSVMETLEALPWQIETARLFSGGATHHVGPSGIGARDNPHGARYSDNPDNLRVCLARTDPRQRGLFAAAWTLGYIATLVRAGVDRISMAAPTGPLGVIYRKTDDAQPFYDELAPELANGAVYPAFHTLAALNCACGKALLATSCSDDHRLAVLGWQEPAGKYVLLANLSASEQVVELSGLAGPTSVGVLDASGFVAATTDPAAFRRASGQLGADRKIRLGGYAVACLHAP